MTVSVEVPFISYESLAQPRTREEAESKAVTHQFVDDSMTQTLNRASR